nr:immunoglobulin light chain junction region [Macaca mulatta]
SQQDYTTPWTF